MMKTASHWLILNKAMRFIPALNVMTEPEPELPRLSWGRHLMQKL
jgi:hypothetical protein